MKLLQRYTLSVELQYEYETLDAIRSLTLLPSQRKNQEDVKGAGSLPSELQIACRHNRALSLLKKYHQGLKVSSRLLARSFKKVILSTQISTLSMVQIDQHLKEA